MLQLASSCLCRWQVAVCGCGCASGMQITVAVVVVGIVLIVEWWGGGGIGGDVGLINGGVGLINRHYRCCHVPLRAADRCCRHCRGPWRVADVIVVVVPLHAQGSGCTWAGGVGLIDGVIVVIVCLCMLRMGVIVVVCPGVLQTLSSSCLCMLRAVAVCGRVESASSMGVIVIIVDKKVGGGC